MVPDDDNDKVMSYVSSYLDSWIDHTIVKRKFRKSIFSFKLENLYRKFSQNCIEACCRLLTVDVQAAKASVSHIFIMYLIKL